MVCDADAASDSRLTSGSSDRNSDLASLVAFASLAVRGLPAGVETTASRFEGTLQLANKRQAKPLMC
jgi:hypothetical protein